MVQFQSIFLAVSGMLYAVCALKLQVYNNGDWEHDKFKDIEVNYGDCIRMREIVCSEMGISADCTLHAETGVQIETCDAASAAGVLFAVPEDKLFIYPPFDIGSEIILDDLRPHGEPLVLRTLSQTPKIYEIKNFFTNEEADKLIESALSITSESHKLQRSTTGQKEEKKIDRARTSDGAFDTDSEVANIFKKRSLELLRIHPYQDSWTDGIQVLRYNLSAAYNVR